MRLDPLLAVAVALLGAPLGLTSPLATWVTASLVFVLFWSRGSRALLLACVLGWGLSTWRAELRVQHYRAQQAEQREQLRVPERCFFRAQIQNSPTWRGESLGYWAQIEVGECETHVITPGRRVRLYGGPRDLRRGDRFEAVAQLAVVRSFRNFHSLDPAIFLSRSGVVAGGGVLSFDPLSRSSGLASAIDGFRARVRDRIEATFSPNAVGMAKALVLGENDLTQREDEAFKASGLAHLLAVSGTHLVFAVLSLVAGLRFVLVRVEPLAARVDVGRIAAGIGIPLSLAYADFAGGSGSAWRAAWMLAAALGVRLLDREAHATRAASASILVGWVSDPLVVFDLSFLLSLAATLGLLTFGRRWTTWLTARGWPRGYTLMAQGFAATLAAMLPCSLLLAMLSPSLSLLGIIANVFAAPFGETIALPLCLVHALLSPFPTLERGTALVASGALLVVRRLALFVAETPGFGLGVPSPTSAQCAVVVLTALASWRLRRARWLDRRSRVVRGLGIVLLGAVPWFVCEWIAVRDGRPVGRLRFTALDVGQGDATLLDLPDGQSMLVDGGGFVGSPVDPGRRVILPELRARRRDRIDVVVLSHPHPDHFAGLVSVLERIEVGELWDTGQGEAEGAGPVYAQLLAAARERGVRIRRPAELCGQHRLGGVEIDVLAPCPDFVARRHANDNSLVMRLRYGSRAILMTGDAELEQERELVETAPEGLRADLLKVGHHGSRTSSSPEFLRHVRPSLAVLSCGVGNSFGHPHVQALESLERTGVRILRTDRSGAVEWETDGQRMWIDRVESEGTNTVSW